MCGIFGLVTSRDGEIGPLLMEAGRWLAYRGYDSAGCATLSASGIDLRKDVGRVDQVGARLNFAEMHGLRGIVQVRWATFGQLARRNAQPHLDCDGDLVGAHNGNIVNSVQLHEQLQQAGHTLRGENDGEICVHVVERHFDQVHDMVQAIRLAYADLAGDYAFVITHRDENRLYAVKKGSGLVVGLGDDMTCCSSDLPSILPFTRRVLRVQDGEIVILDPDGVQLRRVSDGAPVQREARVFEGEVPTADKGEFPHFILKEIYDQPRAARDLLAWLADSAQVERFLEAMHGDRPVFLVGSGTSFHACLLGSYYLGQIAGKPAIATLPAQFIEQYGPALGPDTTAVFVSQSGETKDVLNAVNLARARDMRVLGILNVLGSTLMDAADLYLPLNCGHEMSVAATKTFLNQSLLFLYLAQRLARADTRQLARLPDLLGQTLEQVSASLDRVTERLAAWNDLYYLGYGLTHPVALEGALKLKEITYAHCEGMLSSEFKHGPLSAVQPGYPVVFISAPKDVEMIINHVNEVTCRAGVAIAIAEPDERLASNVQEYLEVPPAGDWINPLLASVATQLIAYRMSVKRGIDPDFPRNLSKTMTVD